MPASSRPWRAYPSVRFDASSPALASCLAWDSAAHSTLVHVTGQPLKALPHHLKIAQHFVLGSLVRGGGTEAGPGDCTVNLGPHGGVAGRRGLVEGSPSDGLPTATRRFAVCQVYAPGSISPRGGGRGACSDARSGGERCSPLPFLHELLECGGDLGKERRFTAGATPTRRTESRSTGRPPSPIR